MQQREQCVTLFLAMFAEIIFRCIFDMHQVCIRYCPLAMTIVMYQIDI